MNVKLLFKLAVDASRRSMLLGMLGAAIPKAPKVVTKAGATSLKGVADMWAMPSASTQAFNLASKVTNGANTIAKIRMYRMARVAGQSRAEAAARAHVAGRVGEATALLSKGKEKAVLLNQTPTSRFNKIKAQYNALARPRGMPMAPVAMRTADTSQKSVLQRIKSAVTGGSTTG